MTMAVVSFILDFVRTKVRKLMLSQPPGSPLNILLERSGELPLSPLPTACPGRMEITATKQPSFLLTPSHPPVRMKGDVGDPVSCVKGSELMNPMTAQYLGFVVVTLILIWAVIELNRRISRRRTSERRSTQGQWIQLNARRIDDEETGPATPEPAESEEVFEDNDTEIHTRAKQNGHYSESKKTL